MSLVRSRTTPYIYQISPFELTARDKHWLDIAVKKDYHRTRASDIIDCAVAGFVQLWRFQDGIVVSEVVLIDKVRYLLLTQAAGEGFIKNLDKIRDVMQAYGKLHDCFSFEVATSERGLQRIFSKRFKEITRIYAEEIV